VVLQAKLDRVQAAKAVVKGGLKGLLSSIPVIGDVVLGGWDGYLGARSDAFVVQLSQAIQRLDESKIDKEFIQGEEFFDLFQKAWRSYLQTRSKEKARLILGIIVETLQMDRAARFSVSIKESFLFLLDQMTDGEVEFLRQFAQGKYLQKSRDDVYQMGDAEAVALDGLFAKEVLRPDSTWKQSIAESMLGREFIQYIKLLAMEN
jgi:hypothetical protein